MKRFYFDLFDGSKVSRDEEGTIFDDLKQAKNSAAISLIEIMRSREIKGDASEVVFLVRDASDLTAFVARLSLQVTSEVTPLGPAPETPPVTILCP